MVWGAIVGLASAQLVGMILYSKLVLGKPWCRATFPGKTWAQISDIQKETFHVEFVLCLLSQLALVMAMHYVIGPYLGVKDVNVAVKIGLAITLLSALVDVPHLVFSRRSIIAFLIDHLYNAFVFVIASISFVYLVSLERDSPKYEGANTTSYVYLRPIISK